MEAYTTYLFAALAIVGGVIAWLGDVIGARLGKKRRTLFGLRPRQSARLIAVVVGALLPLGGLIVATIGSEYARQAVFEMDSLLRSVEELRSQVGDYREQAEQARRDADQALDAAGRSAADLVKAQARVTSLEDVQESLAGQVGSLEGQAARLESQVTQGKREVAQARDDLTQARASLTTAQQGVREAEAALTKAQEEGRLTAAELELAQDSLRNARTAEEGARREVEAKLERLERLQASLDEVQRQLDEIKERDRLVAMREPLFEAGEEITGRDLLDADDTQDQMESTLFELLHLASLVAQRKGVPVGENGRAVLAVAPTPRQVPPGERVAEEVIVRHVASELRTQGAEQWVVVVRGFRRYFANDVGQLEVRFWAKPNVKVFEKGEVLAELRIPAGKTEAEVRDLIYQTIADRRESPVRVIAMARGMLPDRDTGSYGSVGLNDIIKAAAEVGRREGAVVVRVVARQDTYTVGPLLIELQVGEPRPSP